MRENNNFDLIRLLAAAQVVATHSLHHLGLAPTHGIALSVFTVIGWFPGVPIFFVTSGFLIPQSLERSRTIGDYARKRALRIFPGLWACFAACLAVLAVCGQLTGEFVGSGRFWAWLVGQATFVQSYHPPELRGFGTGVLNGSLWTIPVEIGFYVMLPVVYAVFGLQNASTRRFTIVMASLAALSLALWIPTLAGPSAVAKLVQATPLANFWMFAAGAILYRNFNRLSPRLRGKAAYWLAGHAVLSLLLPSHSSPVLAAHYIVLAPLVISAAYTLPTLADSLLHRQDISYGVYLYHMPIVNLLLYLRTPAAAWVALTCWAVTLAAASLSWLLIERPAKSWRPQLVTRFSTGRPIIS